MKEFKKWYKLDWGNSLEENTAAERAWRAALQWALSLKQVPESVAILIKQIEKELEE